MSFYPIRSIDLSEWTQIKDSKTKYEYILLFLYLIHNTFFKLTGEFTYQKRELSRP